jgi:hypothetical protein
MGEGYNLQERLPEVSSLEVWVLGFRACSWGLLGSI